MASQAILSTAIQVRASGTNCGDPNLQPVFEIYVNGEWLGVFTTTGALVDYTSGIPFLPTLIDEVGIYFMNQQEDAAGCNTSMVVDSILVNGNRFPSTDPRTVIRDLGFEFFEPFDGFDVLPASNTLALPGSWRFFIAPYRRQYAAFGGQGEATAIPQ